MSVRFVIDSLDFVHNAKVHHGKILPDELERLQGYLFDNEGNLNYKVIGKMDENGKPNLQIIVTGEMHLCCQRCLGKLAHTLDLHSNLLLVENESELHQFDEDISVDAILATSNMDILNLIEDEIILSLSISSRHQEGECEMHELVENNPMDKKQSEHPFAVLATLKKSH